MSTILRGSLRLFGHSDIALRLPMIAMNLASAVLLFLIAKPYAKSERERVWLVAVFLLLPGILSASLLVDSAALVTLGIFLYVYLRQRSGTWADWLLPLYLWTDASFLLLFLGLGVYAWRQHSYRYSFFYMSLFGLSLWFYGFNTGGIPENRFLDMLGLFAAIMSPIVFVYLVYVLYRRLITRNTDLLWTLSSTSLMVAMVLSFRQRVEVEQFAPYLMLALPLGMQTFYHSYRVRLRPFRKRYRLLFTLALATLVLNAAAVFFNKVPYLFVQRPERYFAYRAHVVKELAQELRAQGVRCIDTDPDKKLQLRLRFYGIEKCPGHRLIKSDDENGSDVTIRYYNVPVAAYDVSKLPK